MVTANLDPSLSNSAGVWVTVVGCYICQVVNKCYKDGLN